MLIIISDLNYKFILVEPPYDDVRQAHDLNACLSIICENISFLTMNKCIKKIRIFALDFVIKSLGKGVSYDLFKKLSNDFGIEAVTVSGDSGQITGAPSELIMGSYIRHGLYNPDIVNLITKRLLTNGAGTFIDIGANIGLITVPVACNSQAIIHAFEPEPKNFGYLSRNVRDNLEDDRLTLHNIALVDNSGSLQFELSSDNFGDHHIRRESKISKQKFNETDRQVIEVIGERLDERVNPDELPHPIVVKIDTQGAEVEVVRGGQILFTAADYIISEYCPYMLLRAGSEPSEFLEFVRSFPYAALMDDTSEIELVLKPVEEVIEAMTSFPQDGSAARHVDILLARSNGI